MAEGRVAVGDINILVVDDCSTSSLLVKHQLIALGAKASNITCVTNTQAALLAAKTRFYSFLVIDYHLAEKYTGLDLVHLLSRAQLISDTTAVLMISSDATKETVLTALSSSGRVRHLLTKPLQTKALYTKMLQALQEQQHIAAVTKRLLASQPLLLSDVILLHKTHASSICVESLIIDTLVERRDYTLLEDYLPLCSQKEHASKVCATAFLLHHQGHISEAVKVLADYVTRNPLCLAKRAFSLTPSNGSRFLSASRITAKLGLFEDLYELSRTYAAHLSQTDAQWLNVLSSYVDLVSDHFKTLTHIHSKRKVLVQLNELCLLTQKQLGKEQQVNLLAFKQLMQCKLLLVESRAAEAHLKLLESLSYFYDIPTQMPIALLKQALPLLAFFGEFSIRRSLLGVINQSCSSVRLQECNIVPHEYDYPFSVETKLNALAAPDQQYHSNSESVVNFLKQRALPPNWSRWLSDYLSGSFSSQIPEPFSYHVTNRE
ncbi:response regulator [Vibrio parahaemolyticus]|nr:response regulator [Vibrio parahaemolyticus]EJG0651348.1 response regulator [Vibrio parahaemolyticus]EJG0768659.1 response regulator [Vibrio parahaemolyticus]EJG0801209.1 response regulator [Vibrio parahaemolyticus]EJG0894859.1 response regulator [Vibrio parahaemolyticus]